MDDIMVMEPSDALPYFATDQSPFGFGERIQYVFDAFPDDVLHGDDPLRKIDIIDERDRHPVRSGQRHEL